MYLSNLCLAAVLTTAASFTVHPLNNLGVPLSRHTNKSRPLRSDRGWNNENFLDALGSGKPSRDNANQQYQRESANRAAARERKFQSAYGSGSEDDATAAIFGAPVPGMPVKPPKAPERDEENPMGGEVFKKMMEKAKQGSNRPDFSERAESLVPPPQMAAPVPVPAPAPVQPQPAMDAMGYYQQQIIAWQQQMTVYAQLCAANPAAAELMTMPPPPPPPPVNAAVPQQAAAPVAPASDDSNANSGEVNPTDYVPKGSGNKDAYEITNPADVYFAQLKRDSFVRTEARKKGDLDTANRAFEDVGVKALNSLLSEELIAKRRQQFKESGGEFSTSRDEMLIPYSDDEEVVDKSYTGISYKQKMMEMKKKRGQAAVAAPAPVVPVPVYAPEPVAVQAVVSEPEPVAYVPIPEPVVAEPVVEPAAAAPVQETESVEEKPNFALPVKDEDDIAAISAPSMEDSEETRKSVRTLMGLILKHRGGSGFGAGRLKEDEAQKLAESVDKVLALLKTEAGMEVAAPAALALAVEAAPSFPLAGTFACVEAVLGMYKNADAASQQDLLIPVRDALVSAVNVISKEIDGSSSSVVSPEAPPAPVFATTMDFPNTYKVTKPDEEEIVVAPVASGTDENTDALQEVYNILKSVAGDEKYGLREIGPDEVSHIKDVLKDMRGVLMDELDNGIPK